MNKENLKYIFLDDKKFWRMDLPNIVAMYRIKNEEKWIKKSLESVLDICSEAVILDDGSTDKTLEICQSFDKVDVTHQDELPTDEVRDMTKLLKMTIKKKPEYILAFDGDEILAPNSKEILSEELNVLYPENSVFEFQVLHIWDVPYKFRCDGVFHSMWRPRLFKIKNQSTEFHYKNSIYPGNLHANHIPDNMEGLDKPVTSKVKILEYGFYSEELRQKKFDYYNSHDPYNVNGDNHLYIISGKGYRSGPNGMEFKKLPKDVAVEI